MKKKVCLLLAGIMVVSSLLSGCGDKPDSDSESLGDNASVNNNADASDMSGAADSSDEPGTLDANRVITVSVKSGEGVQEAWRAVADAYTAIHPDVTVEIDLKPVDGYADWVQKAMTSENPAADIVNINEASSVRNGRAINYYEYADMDSPYSDGTWMEQFDFSKQREDRDVWDALSLESTQVLWFYNADIFEEVGVEPPTTWEELILVCEKIQEAGYQPISLSGDYEGFRSGQMSWLEQIYADQTTRSMINVYRAQEGDYCYDPEVDGIWAYDPSDPFNDDTVNVTQNPVRVYKAISEGEYRADTAGMKTVWSNFAKIIPQYTGGDAFFGTSTGIPLFYQGKSAMTVDGAWRILYYKNDMAKLATGEDITVGETVVEGMKEFSLGVFNMPSMEGEGIEAPARTVEVATGYLGCISKDQEHNDLVVDFLMYYSSKEGMSTFLNAGMEHGYVPSGPNLVYGVEYPEDVQQIFDSMSFIGNCQKGNGVKLARGMSGMNGGIQESYRQFYDYAYKYFTGQIDVDGFLTEHQANMMQYLPEALSTSNLSENDLANPQNEPTGE